MSQALPCGRLTPRWSVAGGGHSTAASIAALGPSQSAGVSTPEQRAMVSVGPPLSLRPAGSRPAGVLLLELGSVRPQVAPSSRLPPSSVIWLPTGGVFQFPPLGLLATIVFFSVAPPALNM